MPHAALSPVRRRIDWPIKEMLLLAYLALGWGGIVERVLSLGLSIALPIYLALLGALVLALLLVSRIAQDALRWTLAVLLFVSAAFMAANEQITGQHFTYESFLNMLDAAGFFGDALAQHGNRMALAALTALPLLLGIGLRPRAGPQLWGKTFGWTAGVAVPVAVLIGFTSMLFMRGGDGARGLPGTWPPIAYALLLGSERATRPSVEPHDVELIPGRPRAAGDIVLLIDESIAPTYLDINDPAGVRSGLAEARPGIVIHNFGIGAAVTHCSLGSNLTLRHGGTRDDYQVRNAAGPTIWQYARRAGYRTVYLDAQRTGGAYQNGMDDAEAAGIDRFVQFGGVGVIDRDHALAERLSEYLRDDVRDVIVVNKIGAHFPVQAKYPEHATRYAPVPSRARFAGIVDTASREGFDDSGEGWRRYRNAYRNTVEWNVGGFFDRLFTAGIGTATILYTADHGQDLNEIGRPGASTHCSSNPTPAEGAVPVVVLAGEGAGGPDWAAAAATNANRASHYQFFPTLLALMGYPLGDYGANLTMPLADELRFNKRFNARLGRMPEWLAIDPAALPRPPASDAGAR
jgi:hypothetical protein